MDVYRRDVYRLFRRKCTVSQLMEDDGELLKILCKLYSEFTKGSPIKS